ncbi:MAG: glycosyltransferase family 2 protein [Candidatus Brocadiaceae bacterium]|nr:glycosyltransferase family 2 protein [Candidatus Brocadiaceae bacterium]
MDLSINICAYNNKEFLRNCLISIYKQLKDIQFEIIVVDNASVDGTEVFIRREFPDILLIKNERNAGVAPARNQSIRLSAGRYVLLLDADTEFVSENFSAVLHYMDSSPEIALLGVQQITFNNQPYPALRTFPLIRDIVLRRLAFIGFIKNSGRMKKHHLLFYDHDTPMEVDYVIGAFQLIRREIFSAVGLLDEHMFYGFEDADYCARIKKAGYKVMYYPAFTIRHYVSGITRKKLLSKIGIQLLFAHFKSYIRFYRKHYDLLKGGHNEDTSVSIDHSVSYGNQTRIRQIRDNRNQG